MRRYTGGGVGRAERVRFGSALDFSLLLSLHQGKESKWKVSVIKAL